MDTFDHLARLARRLRLKTGDAIQPLRWRPAADVHRTPSGWLVKVELAGVPLDKIEVAARGRFLTIRGTRCDSERVQGGRVYSLEISYSQFERCFELPDEVETAHIATHYRNGMLLIEITPKEAEP